MLQIFVSQYILWHLFNNTMCYRYLFYNTFYDRFISQYNVWQIFVSQCEVLQICFTTQCFYRYMFHNVMCHWFGSQCKVLQIFVSIMWGVAILCHKQTALLICVTSFGVAASCHNRKHHRSVVHYAVSQVATSLDFTLCVWCRSVMIQQPTSESLTTSLNANTVLETNKNENIFLWIR